MTLYLVRHASAGRRSASTADIDRPLDDFGLEQANRLAASLGSAGIDQVLSSPALRCLQTVHPLAMELGVEVIVDQSLWEGRGVLAARALIRRLVGGGAEAVLCSHGDVIPMVLDELAAEGIPLNASGCAKGSIWTLDVSDGAVSRGSYQAAP